jgi:hypothetical protein
MTVEKVINEAACEVINSVTPELTNIRNAIEEMDSSAVGSADKVQKSLNEGFESMNERLEAMERTLDSMHDVLEEIRDALKKQKNK